MPPTAPSNPGTHPRLGSLPGVCSRFRLLVILTLRVEGLLPQFALLGDERRHEGCVPAGEPGVGLKCLIQLHLDGIELGGLGCVRHRIAVAARVTVGLVGQRFGAGGDGIDRIGLVQQP